MDGKGNRWSLACRDRNQHWVGWLYSKRTTAYPILSIIRKQSRWRGEFFFPRAPIIKNSIVTRTALRLYFFSISMQIRACPFAFTTLTHATAEIQSACVLCLVAVCVCVVLCIIILHTSRSFYFSFLSLRPFPRETCRRARRERER